MWKIAQLNLDFSEILLYYTIKSCIRRRDMRRMSSAWLRVAMAEKKLQEGIAYVKIFFILDNN